jgi:serine/threonine protein kinase/tetratricopeptide (TPR) repeat protein
MRPSASPVDGFTAAARYSQSYSVCFTATGREPFSAQTVVSVPCCPMRASSSNQTATARPAPRPRYDCRVTTPPSQTGDPRDGAPLTPQDRDAIPTRSISSDAENSSARSSHANPGDSKGHAPVAARAPGSTPGSTPFGSAMSPPRAFAPAAGDMIGPYRILETIGEGGFGMVYLAEQREPVRRRVALKVLKAGMDSTEVVARFQGERQALALMDHPNIAKVFDAGMTDLGRPYFVMEHVPGVPLTHFCDQHRMSIEDRLRLFVDVCRAVQHAHHKGVIHRDLKPSNILVSRVDEKLVPKVIDFGIAKAVTQRLSDATVYTAIGRMMGTPDYMSPEQAGTGSEDIDTRTDIYSLGVILYQLLTGWLPFEANTLRTAAYEEIQRIIREVDPPRPSDRLSQMGAKGETDTTAASSLDHVAKVRSTDAGSLRKSVRGELDWITMKAMEKDRGRRYDSASALAQDVERFLANEPVTAGPPSASYKIGKFVKRNRVGVAFGATVALLLAAGVAGTGVFAVRENARKRELEQREKDLTQVTQFQSAMLGGIDAEQAGRRLISRLARDIEEARKQAADEKAPVADAIGAPKADAPKSESPKADPDAVALALTRVNGTDVALDFIDQTILAPASTAIDQQFKDQPVIDSMLRQTLGETYARLGLLEKSLPYFQRTLALRKQTLGPDHPETINAIGNYGYILHALGKLEEAEPYYAEAVGRLEKVAGLDAPELAPHLSNLAMLRTDMGKPKDAIPLHERALAIQTKARGPEDPDALLFENNLGGALEAIGDNAGAERHYRHYLDATIGVQGEDNIDALTAMNNLAGVLESQGKMKEAEEMYRRSLERRKKLLGTTHPSTLLAVNNLAYLLNHTERAAEAVELTAEAIAASKEGLGDEHPRTLTLHHNHAEAMRRSGHAADAEKELAHTLGVRTRVLGEGHADTLATRTSWALALRDLGRIREAAGELEATLSVAIAKLDPSVPLVGAIRNSLREVYEQLNKDEPDRGWGDRARALGTGQGTPSSPAAGGGQ